MLIQGKDYGSYKLLLRFSREETLFKGIPNLQLKSISVRLDRQHVFHQINFQNWIKSFIFYISQSCLSAFVNNTVLECNLKFNYLTNNFSDNNWKLNVTAYFHNTSHIIWSCYDMLGLCSLAANIPEKFQAFPWTKSQAWKKITHFIS